MCAHLPCLSLSTADTNLLCQTMPNSHVIHSDCLLSSNDDIDPPTPLFLLIRCIFKAAATAYVLLALIVPKLVGGQRNNMPAVLQKAAGHWLCRSCSMSVASCQVNTIGH